MWSGLRGSNPLPQPWQGCALPDELNPHHRPLRKIKALAQASQRVWCLRSELNQRHGDFQSPALPTELQRQIIAAPPCCTCARTTLRPTLVPSDGEKEQVLLNRYLTLFILPYLHSFCQGLFMKKHNFFSCLVTVSFCAWTVIYSWQSVHEISNERQPYQVDMWTAAKRNRVFLDWNGQVF